MHKPHSNALCALTLLVLLPMASVAETLVFSSGIEGGGYWSAATRLQTVAAELGLEVQVEPSTGSLHNLDRLLDTDDPTALVLAQADALQYYLDENPGTQQEIEILENIGQECVFVITSKDSTIRSDADLQQDRNYKIAISSPDSGVAVTYNYMTTLVPEMASTAALFTDTGAAITALGTSDDQAANAVMLVHRPKEHSPEVDRALRNPEQFRFVEIADQRFDTKLPNGDAVYSTLELAIPVPGSEERLPVTTICVKGLLVGSREKIPPAQRDILATVVNAHWMQVYATGQ